MSELNLPFVVTVGEPGEVMCHDTGVKGTFAIYAWALEFAKTLPDDNIAVGANCADGVVLATKINGVWHESTPAGVKLI